jgi:hypothetical protein
MISRSVGPWKYAYPPRCGMSQLWIPTCCHADEDTSAGWMRHRTTRALSNSNEIPLGTEFQNEDVSISSAATLDGTTSTGSTDSDTTVDTKQLPPPPVPMGDRVPIWNHPAIVAKVAKKRENNKLRFRQHVNPLARLYQQPTILPEDWPSSTYTTVAGRPLHVGRVVS